MILNVSRYIPKPLLDYGQGWSNLVASVQNNVDYYLSRVHGLRDMYLPEKTDLTNETAYFSGVYVANEDTTRNIKDKISLAYHTHKNIWHFTNVWKSIVDNICSSNSSVYKGFINYGVFLADSSLTDSPSLVESLSITNTEKPKGDIYIDLGLIPTAGQIVSLRQQLEQLKPIYFNVFIGKLTILTTEIFTSDSNDSLVDGYSLVDTAGATINQFTNYLIL